MTMKPLKRNSITKLLKLDVVSDLKYEPPNETRSNTKLDQSTHDLRARESESTVEKKLTETVEM